MNDHAQSNVVLVTGGSGFLGRSVIAELLRRGYRVRTTIRNLAREAEVRAALEHGANAVSATEAAARLSFFRADLLADEGWDSATDGTDYVLHVASPMPVGEFKKQDPIRPAREGTARVVKAAQRAFVKRIVITSSVQASLPPLTTADEIAGDESEWTDLSATEVSDYARSKTLAERDAWGLVERATGSTTLSTVLPATILGPVLGKDYVGSPELIARMLLGTMPRMPRLGFAIVDTRDLADLHIRAMTHPAAAGERFIASHEFLWLSEIAELLRRNFGERAAKVPVKSLPDWVVRLAARFDDEARFVSPLLGRRRLFSSAKAITRLGWQPRPATDSVLDCATSLLQGF